MSFQFQNLLGAPYRGGNIAFTSNNLLISPVGNRISVTDLEKSETNTLPCQFSSNIIRLAVSPEGLFLLAVDENSRAQFINLRRRIVLHRITFKGHVKAVEFSPNGELIAVGVGKLVQVWRSPGFRKELFSFELVRTFADCNGNVTSLDWSPDSEYLLVGSKDQTVRLFGVRKNAGVKKPFLFLGHRDVIVGGFFGVDSVTGHVSRVYTVSRDGAILCWGGQEIDEKVVELRRRKVVKGNKSEPPSPGTPEKMEDGANGGLKKRKEFDGKHSGMEEEDEFFLQQVKWELQKDKYYCMQAPAKVTTCSYHRKLNLMVIGYSNGVFGLYQMSGFVCIHRMSISRQKITSAVFNNLGNRLAFGCAKLGQLLVWELNSETNVLKQQGHYFDVNCVAYSPDSQLLATGADDNKIKVWNVASGTCFVTFPAHTNAVTALHFVTIKNSLLSASLDGTVRAWNLSSYRNFKTFTTFAPRQFVSLTADASGELVCAGTLDSFEVFVWWMDTGKLLATLSGHEAPVHGIVFSPLDNIVASSSWDKTVRLWDVTKGEHTVETFQHNHDVLTVVYRPDGKQLASSTLDGHIHFWDPLEGVLMYTIEGRRDIAGGRLMTDRRTAANSTHGKYFSTLCYSADGSYILAAGLSKYICMYDVAEQVLLRRFQITHNLSLDGVLDFLNSKNMTESGPMDLIDDDNSDTEEGVDKQTKGNLGFDLPGSLANRGRPIVRTKCLKIAPTGRSFAAATTEGVLVYSMDESFIFDPTDLDMDVTPEAIDTALSQNEFSKALILSLRLNENSLIKRCILSVNYADIRAVAASIPSKYVKRLNEAFAELIETCPYLEFVLQWCQEIFKIHGKAIKTSSRNMMPALKSLEKAITKMHLDLANTCSSNEYMLRYLCSSN